MKVSAHLQQLNQLATQALNALAMSQAEEGQRFSQWLEQSASQGAAQPQPPTPAAEAPRPGGRRNERDARSQPAAQEPAAEAAPPRSERMQDAATADKPGRVRKAQAQAQPPRDAKATPHNPSAPLAKRRTEEVKRDDKPQAPEAQAPTPTDDPQARPAEVVGAVTPAMAASLAPPTEDETPIAPGTEAQVVSTQAGLPVSLTHGGPADPAQAASSASAAVLAEAAGQMALQDLQPQGRPQTPTQHSTHATARGPVEHPDAESLDPAALLALEDSQLDAEPAPSTAPPTAAPGRASWLTDGSMLSHAAAFADALQAAVRDEGRPAAALTKVLAGVAGAAAAGPGAGPGATAAATLPIAAAATHLRAEGQQLGYAAHEASQASVLQLPQPLDSPEFLPALGKRLALLARDGVQQAELQIHPAEMGPIHVQIALDGARVTVDFAAEVAPTRARLEAGLPELASALRDSGLTLAGGGVHEQRRGGTGSQGQEGQGGAQGQGRGGSSASGQGGDGLLREAALRPARGGRSMVDLYA
jgi:flagellar hook-length control protein FliK